MRLRPHAGSQNHACSMPVSMSCAQQVASHQAIGLRWAEGASCPGVSMQPLPSVTLGWTGLHRYVISWYMGAGYVKHCCVACVGAVGPQGLPEQAAHEHLQLQAQRPQQRGGGLAPVAVPALWAALEAAKLRSKYKARPCASKRIWRTTFFLRYTPAAQVFGSRQDAFFVQGAFCALTTTRLQAVQRCLRL